MKKSEEIGLYVPEGIGIKGLVHVALYTPSRNGRDLLLKDEEWIENLVTQVGDEMYAENGAGIASPPARPTHMQLGTGTTAAAKTGAGATIVTFIANSGVALDGTYPQSNNAGAITWRTTWPAGTATNAAITEAVLTSQSAANTAAIASNTTSRVVFTAKDKQAADSLVVTWTHTLLGA